MFVSLLNTRTYNPSVSAILTHFLQVCISNQSTLNQLNSKNMEDISKWEDMPTDCLVNIFGRVPLESRLLDIPLVCKPWHRAVRNPLCWQTLVFPAYISSSSRLESPYRFARNSSGIKLIPFVVDLSQGCASSLRLPEECSREELIYVAEKCPALKILVLPHSLCYDNANIIPDLIVKLKYLEGLGLGTIDHDWIVKIFELIDMHLPNFSGLFVTSRRIDDDAAFAIVALLPKLKQLFINQAEISKANLLFIMQGCKELVRLDAQKCIGFDEDDEEIRKQSSAIKNFRCDGSMEYDDDDYYDSLCYRDVYDEDDSD